jgi:hypothetical protein
MCTHRSIHLAQLSRKFRTHGEIEFDVKCVFRFSLQRSFEPFFLSDTYRIKLAIRIEMHVVPCVRRSLYSEIKIKIRLIRQYFVKFYGIQIHENPCSISLVISSGGN